MYTRSGKQWALIFSLSQTTIMEDGNSVVVKSRSRSAAATQTFTRTSILIIEPSFRIVTQHQGKKFYMRSAVSFPRKSHGVNAWIELVIHCLHLFSFVDNEVFRRHFNWDKICRSSLIKYTKTSKPLRTRGAKYYWATFWIVCNHLWWMDCQQRLPRPVICNLPKHVQAWLRMLFARNFSYRRRDFLMPSNITTFSSLYYLYATVLSVVSLLMLDMTPAEIDHSRVWMDSYLLDATLFNLAIKEFLEEHEFLT